MTDVAALFVDPKGIYPELLGAEACWDEERDARWYDGPYPVVAHPPCNLWVNMAAVNWKRYGRQKPAWYHGGHDGGCFAAALQAVRKWGGCLEHPAGSHAWDVFKLAKPFNLINLDGTHRGHWSMGAFPCSEEGFMLGREEVYWVCEVWQSAPKYKHKARKRTWLLYCGQQAPFELDWTQQAGTHQIGWFDQNKPTLGKREASATPRAFAEELIRLAQWSKG